METKTEYKVAVAFPASPADIEITPDSPTLGEIRDILAAWLRRAENDGKIDRLAMIARAFGETGNPYPYSLRRPYDRYRVGDFTVHYREDPFVQHGNLIINGLFFSLVVTQGGEDGFELIGGYQLANYTGVISIADRDRYAFDRYLETPRAPGMPGLNFYLPGDWEFDFEGGEYSLAVLEINKRKAEKARNERAALLARISPGKAGSNGR